MGIIGEHSRDCTGVRSSKMLSLLAHRSHVRLEVIAIVARRIVAWCSLTSGMKREVRER